MFWWWRCVLPLLLLRQPLASTPPLIALFTLIAGGTVPMPAPPRKGTKTMHKFFIYPLALSLGLASCASFGQQDYQTYLDAGYAFYQGTFCASPARLGLLHCGRQAEGQGRLRRPPARPLPPTTTARSTRPRSRRRSRPRSSCSPTSRSFAYRA
jgi:hypothetical protein